MKGTTATATFRRAPGDRRQREPYASHPLRVAIRILSHYRARDPDVACAALLYDMVEDHAADITPASTPQAALTVLARMFGARAPPGWSPQSPTPPGSPDATSTSSTASTSPPAWKRVPGRG
jgi:hypothetical protein